MTWMRSYVTKVRDPMRMLRLKRFPACNPGHPLIDAALRLVHDQHVLADDIELIEADLHTFSLLRPEPWDEESAGFSGALELWHVPVSRRKAALKRRSPNASRKGAGPD